MHLIQAIAIVAVAMAALGWSLMGMADGNAVGGFARAIAGLVAFLAVCAGAVKFTTY